MGREREGGRERGGDGEGEEDEGDEEETGRGGRGGRKGDEENFRRLKVPRERFGRVLAGVGEGCGEALLGEVPGGGP